MNLLHTGIDAVLDDVATLRNYRGKRELIFETLKWAFAQLTGLPPPPVYP